MRFIVVVIAGILGAGRANALEVKLKPAESAVIEKRLRGTAPKVTGLRIRLEGGRGFVAATVESAPSMVPVSTKRIGLEVLGALYVTLPGDPVAPFGPGGRLAKEGLADDLVWEVSLLLAGSKKGAPPEPLGSFVFDAEPEPVGHDTGEPSFQLPNHPERGAWWLPSVSAARAGCLEVEWNPFHRERFWYDGTGAAPVRIDSNERSRSRDWRFHFASKPAPTIQIQTPQGTGTNVLETPTRLVLRGDGRETITELVREDDRVIRMRTGPFGQGNGVPSPASETRLTWRDAALVKREQLRPGTDEAEYTTSFTATVAPSGALQRYEESIADGETSHLRRVVVSSASGRSRITVELANPSWGMSAQKGPPSPQIDNVRWHAWSCGTKASPK